MRIEYTVAVNDDEPIEFYARGWQDIEPFAQAVEKLLVDDLCGGQWKASRGGVDHRFAVLVDGDAFRLVNSTDPSGEPITVIHTGDVEEL